MKKATGRSLINNLSFDYNKHVYKNEYKMFSVREYEWHIIAILIITYKCTLNEVSMACAHLLQLIYDHTREKEKIKCKSIEIYISENTNHYCVNHIVS